MIETSVSRTTVRLRITAAAGDVGKSLTVSAQVGEDQPRVVRGWSEVQAPATAVVVDHEGELNRPIRYAVSIDGAEVEAATVRIDSDTPILTDPIRGTHVPVTIQTWPEISTARAGHVLSLDADMWPIVIDGPEQEMASTITVIHRHDPASAQILETMLQSTSILRIRPSCATLPTIWASARERRRRRFSQAEESAVVDVVELRHVPQPWPETQAIGNTLGDLDRYMTSILGAPGTMADIHTQWPGTLADIAYTDLTA